MAVKDIINSNTEGIIQATELLGGLGERKENILLPNMPFEFISKTSVTHKGEPHVFGFEDDETYSHYKFNGTEWVLVTTLPKDASGGIACIYNNRIHAIAANFHGIFDDETNTWAYSGTVPYSIGTAFGYGVLEDGIHLFGGSSSSYLKNHYKWDDETSAWTKLTNIPASSKLSSYCVINNELYVWGSSETSNLNQYVYKWNITDNAWTKHMGITNLKVDGVSIPDMRNVAGVEFKGVIHCLGNNNASRRHMTFDGSTFKRLEDLPFTFSGQPIIYDGVLCLAGGRGGGFADKLSTFLKLGRC